MSQTNFAFPRCRGRKDGVEGGEDVVREQLALRLVHPHTFTHRVLDVHPEEGLRPRSYVLERGVEDIRRHHGHQAVALGLEALPDIPFKEGAERVLDQLRAREEFRLRLGQGEQG